MMEPRMLCWIILLLALLLAGGSAHAADPAPEDLLTWREWAVAALDPSPPEAEAWPALADRLRELIDERRASEADLPPLAVDDGLQRAANAHARDMLRRDFMAHENPEGLGVDDRTALLARRFVGITGENIAEHTGLRLDQLDGQIGPLALKITDGWMASPGHRENILRPDYTHAAISAFAAGERLVVVQVFGSLRALLAEPLVFEHGQGDRLNLSMATESPTPRPTRYGLRAADQVVEELVVLDLASDEVAVDPGLFQLMLLFPEEQDGRFAVADGPWLEVR
jgi:uncharacterized protein YkwD